jgi:hypothetical protein
MALVNTSTWPKLLQATTDGFTSHLYVPQFWDDPNAVKLMIESMFSGFAYGAEPPVLRVYVSRGQRFDLEAKLVSAKRDSSVSFEQWIARVIGHKRFCVTLNGLTRWNDSFHPMLHQRFVRPLLKVTGTPVGGLDFYAFIGNYGFTPFGIHDDGEHSFLLHLGDETKYAYLWPHEVFLKRAGKPTSNFDFTGLKRWAVRYILGPGDLLFIPKGVYHVLNSTGFSVTLGFTVFPSTREVQILESLKLLYEASQTREVFFAGDTNWEKSVRKIKLQVDADALAYQHWRYRMILKSNGYVTTPPLELREDFKDLDLATAYFQVPAKFKIYFSETADGLEIFVRGRALRMRSNKSLPKLIGFLNTGKQFTFAQFAAALAKGLTEPAIREVFANFYRLRAFYQLTNTN